MQYTYKDDGGKRVPGGHNGEAVSDPQDINRNENLARLVPKTKFEVAVYAQLDAQGRITAVNSSAFLPAPIPEGWVQIDEGAGDKYHHAQGNYFTAPLHDERGICRYKLLDGAAVERTQAELDADYTPPVPATDPVAELQAEVADLTLALADMIGGGAA